MFLNKKIMLFKSLILVSLLSSFTASSSEDVCNYNLTLDEAIKSVEKYKEQYNVVDHYIYNVVLKKTNGECHYYFFERTKENTHANRYYFLDSASEVLHLGKSVPFKPGTINCPSMTLNDKFFFKKVKKHNSIQMRLINSQESKVRTFRCLYLYNVEFDDDLIPSSINYTFDYKGRLIKWAPVNEAWRKEEKDFKRKREESEKKKQQE